MSISSFAYSVWAGSCPGSAAASASAKQSFARKRVPQRTLGGRTINARLHIQLP